METAAKFSNTLLEKLIPPMNARTTAEKIPNIDMDCSWKCSTLFFHFRSLFLRLFGLLRSFGI